METELTEGRQKYEQKAKQNFFELTISSLSKYSKLNIKI